MADVDLDELERLEGAATPGPWHREMIELGNGGPMTLGIGAPSAPVCIVNGIVESPRGNRDVALIVSMRNQLRALITELRERRAADAWIPCSERMPEPGVPVLIIGNAWPSAVVASLVLDARDGSPSCWSDSDGDGSVFYLDDVTHWRPLPSPPERSGA